MPFIFCKYNALLSEKTFYRPISYRHTISKCSNRGKIRHVLNILALENGNL